MISVTDSCSHVWALRGVDGVALEGYPIALPHASVASAPSLLVICTCMIPTRRGRGVGTIDPLCIPMRTASMATSSAGHLPVKAPSTEEEGEKKAMEDMHHHLQLAGK